MTGRELIIFILQNHLEDEVIFENDNMPGLITIEEAAVKWNAGEATVKTLFEIGRIKGTKIKEKIYILDSQPNPFYVNRER